MADRPSRQSYWNATAPAPSFPRLSGDISVDFAIIGGGMVGVTTARLLKDRGCTVALVEARRVGRQATGRSTAKLTSQHGLIYQTLEQKFGVERARLYAEAQEAGLRTIRALAANHGVEADIESCSAYCWTLDENQVSRIEREAVLAQGLGLPASLTRETGLPFTPKIALRYDDQSLFHPTRYVAGLAATIAGAGCHVFEESRVTDWDPQRIATDGGSVTARHVVMATHLPLGQVGGYYAEVHPYAEPVVAAPIKAALKGAYINVEQPHHSIRTHRGEGGKIWAIAAGSAFKPGHTDDERKAFADLEHWLTGNFDVGPIAYRWVNEDYSAMDSAPMIGWSSSLRDAYLVATGFGAWGLTNGTAAAMILADLAMGRDNPWLEMFDSTRVKPIAGGATFVKENLQIAGHLVSGYLSRRPRTADELPVGEAAIMNIGGERVAVFRDEQGALHAVSAACSHMGCVVGWNENDRTWDCPCHGSRFAYDGAVLHGPAVSPLERHEELEVAHMAADRKGVR